MRLLRWLSKTFLSEEISLSAAALSFTTVFSILPFFAVTLIALNFFSGLSEVIPHVESFLLSRFSDTVGASGLSLFRKSIDRFESSSLGLLGALFLVVTSTKLLFDLDTAVHRIWKTSHRRSLLKRLMGYWIFLLLFPFALAFWVALSTLKMFQIGQWTSLPLGLGTGLLFVSILTLNRVVPSVRVELRSALLGSLCSTLLLLGLDKSFKFLIIKFFSYGKFYGSLAAIPASLLMISLIWTSVLVGVSLTANLQKTKSL